MAALLFQFGRYLMIAGSRPGGQPLNLQGIWNNPVTPPWASAYTTNINLEMNYWPAETTNLSECHEPLLRIVRELSRRRREDREAALRPPRLGAASQHDDLARHAARRRQLQGGVLDGRRRVVLPAPVGALPVHARRKIPARAGVPDMKGAAEFLSRLADG